MREEQRCAPLAHEESNAVLENDSASEHTAESSPEMFWHRRSRVTFGLSLLSLISAVGALVVFSGDAALPPFEEDSHEGMWEIQKEEIPAARIPAGNSTCSFGDPLWFEYIDLHRKVRADLESGNEGNVIIFHCTGSQRCGGLGGELRGIGFTLYASMMAKRAIFIQWEREGQDMADLMGMSNVDWRPPALLLEKNCTVMRSESDGVYLSDPELFLHQLLQMDMVPCVRVQRVNASTLGMVVPGGDNMTASALAVHEAWSTIVPTQYSYGCAAHFLFTFKPAFEGLLDNVGVQVSPGNPVPDSFVAVHLRFGDSVMKGNDTHNFSAVTEALACATALAQDVMGSETNWGIFFAADSAAARQFAMESSAGLPVFVTSEQPRHIDRDKKAGIWGALGDFLMLARAQGLVQWSDPVGFAGRVGPLEISSFSSVAAQLSFLPADHRRVLGRHVQDLAVCGPTPRQVSLLG